MESPTIYMIRHGEKPADDKEEGLSAQGLTRAQNLPNVFGKSSQYNIGYILAEHPKKDGSRARPYETVTPLAADLGLTIDASVSRDDAEGAATAAKAYSGPGNILICWEHQELAKIAQAIGVEGFAATSGWSGEIKYPHDRFDLIWVAPHPYTEITSVISENVPGLDDAHANAQTKG